MNDMSTDGFIFALKKEKFKQNSFNFVMSQIIFYKILNVLKD
jgi:hypothetical protein